VTDPIITAARFLTGQMEWTRHAADEQGGPYAVHVFAEIADCARRLRSVVDGPGARKYLGPCGYVETPEECTRYGIGGHDCATHQPCDGDVYGRVDAATGRCQTCGATVDQAERRAWLDGQAKASDLVWTARGIADALGINVKTLRAWATERRASNGVLLRRARLATYWHNGSQLVPWVEPREGEDVKARGDRLHYVADVMALAEEAAAQRAANEASRAPVREAAEMGA
jgi:hypothetical protein